MHGTSRGRSALGKAGALVLGGAAAIAAVALWPSGSAGATAAARTITVTFGDNGPTPASPVHLTAGDTVVFVNKITQTGSLLLPTVTAQVQSVSVTVKGAASTDFALPSFNKSVSLTYPSAGTVKYTATYTYKLLPLLNPLGINLVPDSTAKDHPGTLAIAAAPVQQQPPAGGGQQPAPGTGSGAGSGTGSGSGSGAGAPVPNAPVGGGATGGTGYQPQAPSVADRTVPHGRGNPATDAKPRTPLTPPIQGGAVPPGQSGTDGTEAILTGSAPNAGLGLPAVLAIVLLSVVTAALVRALINQRRTAEI